MRNSLYSKIDSFLKLASLSLESKLNEARRILGVDENVTLDALKKRYQQLVYENHPDRGGSSNLLRSIIESYELLSKHTYGSTQDGMITVFVKTIDGQSWNKKFQNKEDAKEYIESVVGTHFEFSSGYDYAGNKTHEPYAVSDSGDVTIRMRGCTWKDLYPDRDFWMSPKELEESDYIKEYERERFRRLQYENPGVFADEISEWLDEQKRINKERLPKSHRLPRHEYSHEEIKQRELLELAPKCPYKGSKAVCDDPDCEHGWLPF